MDKIKVLIAEDDNISAEILGNIIKKERDMELIGCAENGISACTMVEELKPDVLLLDLIMPVMDGISVIHDLHTRFVEKEYAPYIIVISSVRNDNVTAEAFKDGADYFILKPYDKELLVSRIRACMAGDGKSKGTVTEKYIEDALHEFGVTSNLKGYRYLKDAVLLCMNDETKINYITKTLYPDIADRNGTTIDCVERAMRHSIKLIWDKNDGEDRTVLGQKVSFAKNRPTNSEFIAMLTMMCIK